VSLAEPVVFAVAVVVQVLGLLGVVLARVSEHSSVPSFCQLLSVACLLIVCGIGMLAIQSGIGCWWICATTLPLMAVGATLDLKSTLEYRY